MIVNLNNTFKNKRVFLTGHTGFKGTWLLLILKELGAEVKGYSLPPKNSNDLFNTVDGKNLCHSVIADVRDQERLKKELVDFQPDFVFHLAAQALVIDSYTWPVETYATNVMGTVHVLDALRSLTKPCYSVMITTDKVYENFETTEPYPETARLGGYDPYSNSKACAELAISAYRNCFLNPDEYSKHGQAVAAARSGNVIGGGDWSENRLVPDIARALLNSKPIHIRNPDSVRPWQHVLDPLFGYLQLAHRLTEDAPRFATGYNFGPETNDERTVLEMCQLAINCWGSGEIELAQHRTKHHEAGLLKLSIEKAKHELAWKPQLKSDAAVKWSMDWYRMALGNERAFTELQIREYLRLI